MTKLKQPGLDALDILHEAKRLRLLAAAIELQHFTSTAANVVPIPGGERVIAIGEPAEVARLLCQAPAGLAVEAVLADTVLHGTGMFRVHADGAVEHIPHDHSEGGHHD